MDESQRQQLRAQRAARRRRAKRLFVLFSVVFVVSLSALITFLMGIPERHTALQTSSQTTSVPDTAESESAAAASTGESAPDAPPQSSAQTEGDAVNACPVGPVESSEPVYHAPTAAMLALPENGRVEMSYFDDALFIGDSLTQGFQVYTSAGIANAHFAAYVGAGPKQLMSGTVTNLAGESVAAIDEILAANPKKVYILLGTNTLTNLTDEALLKYYADFLDYLAPQLPADTVYYVQAMPPVTAEKQAEDEKFLNSRIVALNEQIALLAYAREMHYLNLYGALADDSGNLSGELSAGGDGIHLNSAGYGAWREFLVTHTAYSTTSPYIAGSPYATT